VKLTAGADAELGEDLAQVVLDGVRSPNVPGPEAASSRHSSRVGRPMPYVRYSFWRGGEVTSLPQLQADDARWSAEVAGRRQCTPLDAPPPQLRPK
jgi:hypothetical protein